MAQSFPSQVELASRAGFDPWRLANKFASGNPAEIAVLAREFSAASGDAHLAGQLAREASELTAQAYAIDGTPVHDPGAHVAATRRRLGDDGATMRMIALILDGVSDDLENRTRSSRDEVSALDGELATLRNQFTALQSRFADRATPPEVQAMLDQYVVDAVNKVIARGNTIQRSIDAYEQTLAMRLKSLSDLGYTPPAEVNEGPGDPNSTIRVLNLNIGMGYQYPAADDRGVEPWEIGRIAEMILNEGADVANLQEWHDVPGLRAALERELESRTGREWNLYFSETVRTGQAGAGYDNVPAGTLMAVQTGAGVASVQAMPPEPVGYRNVPGHVRIQTEGGGTLDVFNTHVPTESAAGHDEQARQTEALRRLASQTGNPTVLTGDFNQTGLGEGFTGAGFGDAGARIGPTLGPAHRRIDYTFTYGGASSNGGHVLEGDPHGNGRGSDLTDHDGLVVDIDVP